MATSTRWTMRQEPYDPDARDADNDGIVQEQTPWERPAGTRLVDELGRAITRGANATNRPRGLRVVDRNGNTVDYTPTYDRPGGRLGAGGGTALGEAGALSLRERGLPTLREITAPRVAPVQPEPAPVGTPETGPVTIADRPEQPKAKTQGRQPARISGTFAEIFPKWESEIPEIIKAQRTHETSNAYENLALREIQRRQGFDGLPEVVPSTEWQDFVDNNPDHIPIFRGIASWGSDASASDLVEQFRSGPYFAGNGIYGGGTYTATDAEDVLVYLGRERGDTSTDGLIEMLIRPDARIIEWGDARDLTDSGSDLDKHIKDTDDELSWDLRDITNDTGRTAAMFGYDAILVKDKYSGEGDFYILLNRTAVVVKGAEGK